MNGSTAGIPTVLLFDVNETLLDLTSLHAGVDKLLLEKGVSRLWFSNTLYYALAMTVGGQFRPFSEVGASVLRMMAESRGLVLDEAGAREALLPLRSAPAHPDVAPALAALRAAGFRMAPLTNSACDGVRAQLGNAGIERFFERQLSVETIATYKPHRDVYLWAAQQMQAPPTQCMLVAAHPWDVAGAAWAGMRTAFIARGGVRPLPGAPQPDIEALDLQDLANQLCALKTR